jgi:alkyl hydroperoxide reductase subunit AhpC
MVRVGQQIEDFEFEVYHNQDIKKLKFSDFQEKWLVLLFYPADFTFVCPTELEEAADKYEEFKHVGAEILSVSTDTVYVHKAWHANLLRSQRLNILWLQTRRQSSAATSALIWKISVCRCGEASSSIPIEC